MIDIMEGMTAKGHHYANLQTGGRQVYTEGVPVSTLLYNTRQEAMDSARRMRRQILIDRTPYTTEPRTPYHKED